MGILLALLVIEFSHQLCAFWKKKSPLVWSQSPTFDTISLHNKWINIRIPRNRDVFQTLNVVFVFIANSAEPDEMPHLVAFHLDLHCLQKCPFTFSNEKKKK